MTDEIDYCKLAKELYPSLEDSAVCAAIAQAEALNRIAASLEKLVGCVGQDSKYGGLFSVINWKDMP